MAYNYEYPYFDSGMANADWIIAEIKAIRAALEGSETYVLDLAKAYTDEAIAERLANVESMYNQFKSEVNTQLGEITTDFNEFVAVVNARMALADVNIARIEGKVDSALSQANEYTQNAIANNNEYIIDQTSKAASGIKVLNYFTGERVSIQDMFDYLAQFHLSDAITVADLVARQKTVAELVALDMTMTGLATRGGQIIPA